MNSNPLRLAFLAAWLLPLAPVRGAEAPPVAEPPVLLTPLTPLRPEINGPKIYGVRPGSPFLYRIPCTGERPLTFGADGLPPGLVLDPKTGIITGRTAAVGTHRVMLRAQNARGDDLRELRVVVGDRLALTPPMGWNSWYIHYNRVTEAILRQAADEMLRSGMADFGYQYVNVDDCWTKKKGDPPYNDAAGAVLPNEKFPDMPGLARYVHERGLKAGLYISPGPWTCTGYAGAYGHEAADARAFAAWGFDFLKYDWCTYGQVAGGKALADLQKPYRLMAAELAKVPRDIVFNLCQYGRGDVWTWGGEVGNSWRTTGDLGAVRGSDLPGFYQVGLSNAQHWQYARPGAWNDPDYILLGWVGDAYGMGPGLPTALTPNEQYSYMSMWSLMASPLIFGGDMAKLDPFTLNVLCNREIIDVDQDALGHQGRIVHQDAHELIFVRDLEGGAKAVGLFNLAPAAAQVSVRWSELGLKGDRMVRDLWRQKDIGRCDDLFVAMVPRHGVVMVKLTPP